MPWLTDTLVRAAHIGPQNHPFHTQSTTVRAGLIPVTRGPSLLKSLSEGNFRETRQKGFLSSRGSNAPHLLSLHTSGYNCAKQPSVQLKSPVASDFLLVPLALWLPLFIPSLKR